MSKNPKGLTVRDRRTGQPVTILLSAIPKELWPETWYDNVYWLYSRALVRAEVQAFFFNPGKEISPELAQKLATYIYDFAANTAVAAWLFSDDRPAYLEYMRPCLLQLAALKAKATTRSGILDMLHVALNYAIDPF